MRCETKPLATSGHTGQPTTKRIQTVLTTRETAQPASAHRWCAVVPAAMMAAELFFRRAGASAGGPSPLGFRDTSSSRSQLFAMLALLLAPSALVPNSRPAVSSRRVALGEVSRFALGAAALAAGPLAAKADVASIAAAANVRNPLPTPAQRAYRAVALSPPCAPAGQGSEGA